MTVRPQGQSNALKAPDCDPVIPNGAAALDVLAHGPSFQGRGAPGEGVGVGVNRPIARNPRGSLTNFGPPRASGASEFSSPSKPLERRAAAACDGKIRHASPKEAHATLRTFRKGQKRTQREAYRCSHCGGWHTGRKS